MTDEPEAAADGTTPADPTDAPAPDDPSTPAGLGRALTIRRIELGLDRRAVAEAAGISYPYLSQLERGVRQPSSRVLRALSGALGLAPADLLTRADLPAPDAVRGELREVVRTVLREELGAVGPRAGHLGGPTFARTHGIGDVASLRAAVLAAAAEMLGQADLRFDDDGDLPIRRGDVMIFVRVIEDPLAVLVFSPVLVEVDPTPDLLERLNELNAGVHLVRHCATHGGVVIDLELFGVSFQPEDLALACRTIADAGAEVGPAIQEEFGGRLFLADEPAPKPRRDTAGYL